VALSSGWMLQLEVTSPCNVLLLRFDCYLRQSLFNSARSLTTQVHRFSRLLINVHRANIKQHSSLKWPDKETTDK
jgi:hypothetical protein